MHNNRQNVMDVNNTTNTYGLVEIQIAVSKDSLKPRNVWNERNVKWSTIEHEKKNRKKDENIDVCMSQRKSKNTNKIHTTTLLNGKCSHIIHDKIIYFDNIKFYFLKVWWFFCFGLCCWFVFFCPHHSGECLHFWSCFVENFVFSDWCLGHKCLLLFNFSSRFLPFYLNNCEKTTILFHSFIPFGILFGFSHFLSLFFWYIGTVAFGNRVHISFWIIQLMAAPWRSWLECFQPDLQQQSVLK